MKYLVQIQIKIYRNKVAKLLERSDSLISNILYKELEESKKYNKLKHDGLIDMCKHKLFLFVSSFFSIMLNF